MASVTQRTVQGPRPVGQSAVTGLAPLLTYEIPVTTLVLWFFRLLLITPFVLMGPELVSAVLGRPNAIANISTSTADVFGTSSFLIFVMMLTVTPIYTMTGWTWHLPLRRDYGIAMFVTATTDLLLAATTTGDTFSGGVLGRLGSHTFLVVGTLSTLLLIPLVLTANRPAQRRLGGYWKRLHRLVYVIWGLILVHLLLLFGVGGTFLDAVALSVPLAVLRVPTVRRWWIAARRARQHRVLRVAGAVALVAVFAAGLVPVVQELALKGVSAFVQQPVD